MQMSYHLGFMIWELAFMYSIEEFENAMGFFEKEKLINGKVPDGGRVVALPSNNLMGYYVLMLQIAMILSILFISTYNIMY